MDISSFIMKKKDKLNCKQFNKLINLYKKGFSVPIPSMKYYNWNNPDCLFILERPGPKAYVSGEISYDNDDPSAKFTKELINDILQKENITYFFTNASLFYPKLFIKNGKPTNAPSPSSAELKIFSIFLKQQIDNLNPKIIVTLGSVAKKSLIYVFRNDKRIKSISKKSLKLLFSERKNIIRRGSQIIYLLYHTSKRSRISRSKKKQIEDWKLIPKLIKDFKS